MLKKAKNKLLVFLTLGTALMGKTTQAERPKVESWADAKAQIFDSFKDDSEKLKYSKYLYYVPEDFNKKFGFNSSRGVCCSCILLGKNGSDEYYAFRKNIYLEDEGCDIPCKFYGPESFKDIEENIKTSKLNTITDFSLPESYQLGKSIAKTDGVSLFYREETAKGERIIEYPLCLPNRDESDLLIIGEKDGSKYVKQWPKWLTDYFFKIDENKKTKLVCALAALGIISIPTGVVLTKLLKNDEYVSNNRKMQEITDFEEEYDEDEL